MANVQFNAFQGEEHRAFTLTHEGARGAVLLVHGFPGSPNEMRDLAELFYAHGWTVRAILLPGFGADFEHVTEYTNDDWVAAVSHHLHELQQTYPTVLLMGHSMGGAISIQVAAKNRPSALILTAPFWKVNHIAWKALPILKVLFPQPKLFKYLRLDFNKPDVREGIHNFMPDADLDDPDVQAAITNFRVSVKMFAQIYRAGQAAFDASSQIQCDALVLQGTRDELVRPQLTQHMISRFQGETRYIEVNAEHDLILSRTPSWDAMQHAIVPFIQQLQQESIS